MTNVTFNLEHEEHAINDRFAIGQYTDMRYYMTRYDYMTEPRPSAYIELMVERFLWYTLQKRHIKVCKQLMSFLLLSRAMIRLDNLFTKPHLIQDSGPSTIKVFRTPWTSKE